MDTCTDIQIELERKHHGAIDALPEKAASHITTCVACQEYRRELAEMGRVMQLELAPTLDEIRWKGIADQCSQGPPPASGAGQSEHPAQS